MNYIQDIQQVVETMEKVKGFWDETGLDMHIAVIRSPNGSASDTIAVSTKHWFRVHYIHTKNLGPNNEYNAWDDVLKVISEMIGRKLIRSEKGDYVYINKLSKKQTQKVFDSIVTQLKLLNFFVEIERHFESSWEIDGSYVLER